MSSKLRVLLADDHPLVLSGLRSTILDDPDIEIVGEAGDGEAVIQLCKAQQPDVLVLDLSMPGLAIHLVVTTIREVCPKTQILILSAYDDDAYVQMMITTGVSGYLLKDEAPDSILSALHTVAQGATWFSRTILEKAVQINTTHHADDLLNEREWQILVYLAQGWDNNRIAKAMHLAEQTVRNYTSRVYSKIGVSSRAEAIIWAREHGIVQENPGR